MLFISLLAASCALANPLPQSLTSLSVSRVVSTASPIETAAWGSIPFGLYYDDTEGGKRIHPFLRKDLCVQVVNETLVPGALLSVDRCLNNTSPLPAARNLFNLTTLNTTSEYNGLIAPANQTELCMSGKVFVPANDTDYSTREDREITLQPCNASDSSQLWRYGIDERVPNGEGKAYKLSLNNQTHCASVLRTSNPTPDLVFSMLPCVTNSGGQILMVVNGTSTPTEKITGLQLPMK